MSKLHHPKILLASGSPYRRQLLAHLCPQAEALAPRVDETPRAGESPKELATRLAQSKALSLAEDQNPDCLIIGSDQVASLKGEPVGKPGNRERARAQLREASGHWMDFYTGLCLHDSRTGETQTRCETYRVKFRHLSQAQIDRYLSLEQPYDCAGSFKAEGLGIRLFERMEGADPNTLIGLPLIALTDLMLNAGYDPLETFSSPDAGRASP